MLEIPSILPHLRTDDPTIGPFDAELIAELPAHGTPDNKVLILTPNAAWIPKVYLWRREVYVRKDGRFGFDDRTLWPQYYAYAFDYLCCIPRQPEDPKDPLAIFWWTPRWAELVYSKNNSVDVDLVKLPPERIDELKKWRDQLVEHVAHYQANNKISPLLDALTTSMRHSFIRCSMAMTRNDLREVVPEFQRFCLDIIAWLRFVEEFSPRSRQSPESLANEPVRHDLMGAVTEDPAVVQLLHQMRIPVWWVVPARKLVSTTNIMSTAALSLPRSIEERSLHEPRRVLCAQPAGSLLQQSMQRINCLFLDKISPVMDTPAPVNADIAERPNDPPTRFAPYPPVITGPILKPRQYGNSIFKNVNMRAMLSGSSSTPSAAPSTSASAPSTSRITPSQPANPLPQITTSQQLNPSGGRDRFQDVNWDLMPAPLKPWEIAVANIQRPNGYRSAQTLGHAFPEANNLAGSESHREVMLVTWLSRRDAVIWLLLSRSYETIHVENPDLPSFPSAQSWKAYLLRRLKNSVGQEPASGPVRTSRGARLKQVAADWFEKAKLPLTEMPAEVTFENHSYPVAQQLPRDVVTRILWECFENNFRLEVTRLDEQQLPELWLDPVQRATREKLVRDIFFDPLAEADMTGGDFIVERVRVSKDSGLASSDWSVRRLFIANLAKVLSTWPAVPLHHLPTEILTMSEEQLRQAEITLVDADSVPAERRPYGTSDLNVKMIRQVDAHGPDGPQVQLVPAGTEAGTVDLSAQNYTVVSPSNVLGSLSKHAQKKERQWIRWQTEIIPALVEPFLVLLKTTEGLRNDLAGLRNDKDISADGLLSRGLFPCAPMMPSLAVDVNMLDYARELFVRLAPNTSGWCEAVEAFLANRRYHLAAPGSLRRKFANALHWYCKLLNAKEEYIGRKLDAARKTLRVYQLESSDHDVLHERPSEYLRSRCPACFGSDECHDDDFQVDAIVCVDACFTQKRRHNARGGGKGPVDAHPNSVFLSESQVKEMEDLVEGVRGTRRPAREDKPDDGYEGSMKVPTSVLDDCHASFTAADSKRIKASTQFFADTGLMALLCRHDQVLWLVNMTSPGERQHYVFALLKELFHHLPQSMKVGVLYDIGCQTHRSTIKWEFLDSSIRARITWGISVFHAFGHQWACQIIYHPRKCKGFGLTDGEGCERFWSMIKLLIPSLRVSGYYQRLYMLDNHVEFLTKKNKLSLGFWLARKWKLCQEKKTAAGRVLKEVGVSLDTLRDAWDAQVKEQTKPLVKQSKEMGNKAIEEIMTIIENRKSIQAELQQINVCLVEEEDNVASEDLRGQKELLVQSLAKIQTTIKSKREKLGIDGRANLAKYKDNQFLQLRLNSQALKHRIRFRLRERKFELERLERAYRQTSSSEKKLQSHIQSSIKRHEPAVMSLVTKHNKLVDEMEALKVGGKSGPHAIIPPRIERTGLFKLDVDDEVWQDIGLADDDGSHPVPDWLGDEKTRRGIRAVLEWDRCLEEETRLSKERCSIQEWLIEEWACLEIAMQAARNDLPLLYQLQEHKEFLCVLCKQWQDNIGLIPTYFEMPDSWGPSNEDMDILAARKTFSFGHVETEEESDSNSEMEMEDDILLEAIEVSAVADAYRDGASLAWEGLVNHNIGNLQPTYMPTSQGNKRLRM
ncbi:hypothetical protein H0H93_007407 [Arthromyces matolae]|nr:hypothetical protein H0H93_007407 [Arthromyces matolae]